MNLIELNWKTHVQLMNKAGLHYYEQLIRFQPNKYNDCSTETGIAYQYIGSPVVVIGTLISMEQREVSGNRTVTNASVKDRVSECLFKVTWFGGNMEYNKYSGQAGESVFVYGKLEPGYNGSGYQITQPVYFSTNIQEYFGINPVYKKRKGMSADFFKDLMVNGISSFLEEPLSDDFRKSENIQSDAEAASKLHFPESRKDAMDGYSHFALEDMMYFAVKMLWRSSQKSSPSFEFSHHNAMNYCIRNLPFKLTDGQREVINSISEKLTNGVPVNALIQGDVACGKSIVAFLLMILAAENGYQACIMAPTVVLASQHYKDLTEIANMVGLKTALLDSSIKKNERNKILKNLKNGELKLLVGTHAITAEDVIFKDLKLCIIDEEQRFGVEKRDALKEKAKGAAYLSMTATPIPRTLANAIYGDDIDIYSIKTMPDGRKSVTTMQMPMSDSVPSTVISELQKGRQAYVICPLIEEDDEDTMNCRSVEETLKIYSQELGYKYSVGMLTGKMKDKEMLDTLNMFTQKKIDVLICTTVVEVGVNNPNASVIVVQNAERFGLSTLHQLRGRVKRGTYKPYCVLMSDDEYNPRLRALCETEDGFRLSEMDLELRKSGNLFGLEQSGLNKHVELIREYPGGYDKAKELARKLCERGEDEKFIETMEKIYEKQV